MEYPEKPVQTNLPIIDAIRDRWSPRMIGSQKVEQEKIDTFFEAARWAPSSSNVQPWRYLYATKDDGEARIRLESLLTQGNAWAKLAYILMIVFIKKTQMRSSGEAPNYYAQHDTGASTGFLALQLPSLGLAGHQMGGFDKEHANKILGVPKDFEPSSMMAIGYPTQDNTLLSDKQREQEKAERVREPQSSFVFHASWGAGTNDQGL